MPHDDGRKSRCKLVTTMTNRSSPHADVDHSDDHEQHRHVLPQRLNHSNCGNEAVADDQTQYHGA